MNKPFLRSLQLESFLSFAPDSPEIALSGLNVVIGPNGSGKSNMIEAVELLRATPDDLSRPIREGGGVREWQWKGGPSSETPASARVTAKIIPPGRKTDLRYELQFAEVGQTLEIEAEVLEEASGRRGTKKAPFYYRYREGRPSIVAHGGKRLAVNRRNFRTDQSILAQRKDPDRFPELTQVGAEFARIQTFREWSFGRRIELRKPQPTDLPSDGLLSDSRNLGLMLNELENSKQRERLSSLIRRFYPRFDHLSTKIQGGTIQIYLHEDSLSAPIPATRLSDGTLRFLALLAILLRPENSPLVCIEEPELGLHPDALAIVAELLVEASERTQLIITTHSDVLVSALSDHTESVLVCEQLGGGTEMRRLDSNKLQFWLDKYRLGELWRIGKLGGNLT